jgi:hypothetical protein
MSAPRPAVKQQQRIKTRRLFRGLTRTARLLKQAAKAATVGDDR